MMVELGCVNQSEVAEPVIRQLALHIGDVGPSRLLIMNVKSNVCRLRPACTRWDDQGLHKVTSDWRTIAELLLR